MASTYKQFLASPSSSMLAANAALHYITTTTIIRGDTDILKHFSTLRNQITKSDEVLEVIDAGNVVAFQTKTSVTFLTSGGPYLPGLDDNFLAEVKVDIPIMHIVSFDGQGKIAQIRQSWDQGALLKAVDVIGRTGRNWPIRDITEQLRAITTCIKSPEVATAPAAAVNSHARGSSNALRDPHASLELFASREQREQAPDRVVSPYSGTRPRERSITQVIGGESDDEDGSPTRGRSNASPSKAQSKAMAPKGGAGKNYQPSRLFNEDEEDQFGSTGRGRGLGQKSGGGKGFPPNRLFDNDENSQEPDTPPAHKGNKSDNYRRPHPTKYDHFDFADNEAPVKADRSRSTSKHDSNWSFDDFATPQKAVPSRGARPQDVRHWDPEVDAASNTPGPYRAAAKPRRHVADHQDQHFDIAGDGPEAKVAGTGRSSKHNNGGLYENNFHNDDGISATGVVNNGALGNITNHKNRDKESEIHWGPPNEDDVATPQPFKMSDDRKKAVRGLEASWSATDESPVADRENSRNFVSGKRQEGRINVAGDGMGKKMDANSDRADSRGINIAGDGMGGRKGTPRDWMYPEDN